MQTQMVERGQSDISGDYHLKILGLCSRFGLKEQVEDLLHKLGLHHEVSVAEFLISADSDNLAAFIQFDLDLNLDLNLDLDLDLDLDQEKKDGRRRQTLQTLTTALLDPSHRPHLRNLSRYGLLGFSPGTRDDAGNVWNTMGLKASFITGPVSFRDIQQDAAQQGGTVPTPSWLQTVTVASLSTQMYWFGDSAASAASTVAGAGQLATDPTASWWEAGVLAGKFLVTDRLFLTGSKELAKKENARSALKTLYANVGNVVVQLREIKNNINSLDAQYKLLEAVSTLSMKEAEMLKTCNELSSHYDLSAVIQMTDSAHSGVKAATHGIALAETAATSGAGAGAGAGVGWMPLGLTLAYAAHAGWTFWEAGESIKRSTHCKQAATLLELTHSAAVECTIFLGWVSTMSEDFTLSQVQKHGGAREKKLAKKLLDFKYDICRDIETKEDMSSRAVIQRYVNVHYKEIGKLHKNLTTELDGIYGENTSKARPKK